MSLTINRTRSPKYPNFPLGTAVRQVGKIHAADRRNIIERLNAAKHMGYSGLSGPSEKAIGTLVQYGLLELAAKGQVRVSQLAVDILHPVGETERKLALVEAAFHPEIFNTLKEQFPDGVSEASLRSYLVRQNFMDRAISPLSKAYVETCAFLEQSGASDSHRNAASGAAGSILDEEDDMIEAAELGRPDPQPAPAPTKAQVFSAAPTVGPPSVAEVSNLPPEGFSQAIFPLVDGQVSLTFPAELSSDGYAELSEYLAIFLKRAERQRRQQEAAKRDDLPGVG